MFESNLVTSLHIQEKLLQRVKAIFVLYINALEKKKKGLKFQFD